MTASIMKLVINGFAGAACIEMGGYDDHGGMRREGEVKDERAGRCMGACIEYAARIGVPLMMYVFSDGSLSSNGAIDTSAEGRGKCEWDSDNSSTAASFFLVYNPGGRPVLRGGTPDQQARHQQIGYMDGEPAGCLRLRYFADFAKRIDGRAINKRVLEHLVKTGAFDFSGGRRGSARARLPRRPARRLAAIRSSRPGS